MKDKAGIYQVSYTQPHDDPKKCSTVKRSTGACNRKEAEQKRFAIACDILGMHTGLKPASAD